MRHGDGVWIGWPGGLGPRPRAVHRDGMDLVPLRMSREDVEGFYEGFSNGTLWPLYHDLVAKPEFHREWWDSTSRSTSASPDAAGQAQQGRHGVGARLPNSIRARAARCARTCASASTCIPSRRANNQRLPWRHPDPRGPPRRRPRRLQARRRGAELHPPRAPARRPQDPPRPRLPARRPHRARAPFPISIKAPPASRR